ncbi:hypothetical protein VY487_004922 [Salmonella enterica]|nr:hypothetical protein [Salmonella enterica]EHN6577921.1 hypothetical protein [Salmonella enterica subsp. enterica serovar Anecho]EKO0906871.1 hypothetical protein [Salmonella enterica subsp. enterica]EGD2776929.1 hypothetical protein [Salmonella enterica]EGG5220056.1 hypothetical protein [Salmonella enterica]
MSDKELSRINVIQSVVEKRMFAKPPRHDFDVHRPLGNNENLAATFTWREQRKVSKNLTLHGDLFSKLFYPVPVSHK